jgi:hypothetical protein
MNTRADPGPPWLMVCHLSHLSQDARLLHRLCFSGILFFGGFPLPPRLGAAGLAAPVGSAVERKRVVEFQGRGRVPFHEQRWPNK